MSKYKDEDIEPELLSVIISAIQDSKGRYRIRRNGVTFVGNLEKDAVVKIIDIKDKVARIDNGYYEDMIPVKELEPYIPKMSDYKLFPKAPLWRVYGYYKHHSGYYNSAFAFFLLAESRERAEEVFNEIYFKTEEYKEILLFKESDWNSYEEENKGEVSLVSVDLVEYDEELEISYSYELVASGHYIDGIGSVKNALISFMNRDDAYRFRQIYLNSKPVLGDFKVSRVYYYDTHDNSSSIKAIKDCERKGIDPHGY